MAARLCRLARLQSGASCADRVSHLPPQEALFEQTVPTICIYRQTFVLLKTKDDFVIILDQKKFALNL